MLARSSSISDTCFHFSAHYVSAADSMPGFIFGQGMLYSY